MEKVMDKESLNHSIRNEIIAEIKHNSLREGDKIPTEKYFTEKYGVSRSTVRDAISGLKAMGILKSVQGSGVFVNKNNLNHAPSLPLLTEENKIAESVSILEVRIPLETEIAKLAAKRRSINQEIEIINFFDKFKAKVESGFNSEQEDFNFHLAIAKATNNQRMVDVILWAGQAIIPRSQLYQSDKKTLYVNNGQSLVKEHAKIVEAISNGDSENAAKHMNEHLSNSLSRYRNLLYQSINL